MRGIVVLRIVAITIALVLSVVLIARGNVVAGVLVGVLAVTRIAIFASMARRRRQFRERFPRRWERPQ